MNKKLIIQKCSLLASDLFAIMLSFILSRYLANLVNHDIGHITLKSIGISKVLGLTIILIFWYQEQYVKRRPSWEELRLLYKTILIFALLHMMFNFLISHFVIKTFNVIFWLLVLIILPLMRAKIRKILHYFKYWSRTVYIIGTDKVAINAYELLMHNPDIGYEVVAFITLQEQIPHEHNCPKTIMPYTKLLELNSQKLVNEIIIALPQHQIEQFTQQINLLQSLYTFVSIVPDISGLPLYGASVEHFFGNDQLFLRLQNNLSRRLNRIIKRTVDIILSSLFIILLSPLLLLISIAILVSTSNSIFFKHKRIGKDGKSFYCLKFQTMYHNSQELLETLILNNHEVKNEWATNFKLKNDPRITAIGKILRETSLDELPQLFNVLFGTMSLVGPRPIIADEIVKYKDSFYYYKLVSPGITGLWQISGRNDIDYNKRVRLDVCYIKNWSLWYDCVILCKTVQVVFWRQGAY